MYNFNRVVLLNMSLWIYLFVVDSMYFKNVEYILFLYFLLFEFFFEKWGFSSCVIVFNVR